MNNTNLTRVKKIVFESIGETPLTTRERELVKLGAVFQVALTFWPIETALREIRWTEPSAFEVRNYSETHLKNYTNRIIEKLKKDGAKFFILDETV